MDSTLSDARVIRVLDRERPGKAAQRSSRWITVAEHSIKALADWEEPRGVDLEFFQTGKPTQDSYIKQFNRTFSHEVLDFMLSVA